MLGEIKNRNVPYLTKMGDSVEKCGATGTCWCRGDDEGSGGRGQK